MPGTGLEAGGGLAALEGAAGVPVAIACMGQDVDDVGNVHLLQGSAHRVEVDGVGKGVAGFDLRGFGAFFEGKAGRGADAQFAVAALGAGCEVPGGIAGAVGYVIGCAARDDGLVAYRTAVGQSPAQPGPEGDGWQAGGIVSVGAEMGGDVFVGPRQFRLAGGGVRFHDGFVRLATAGARAGLVDEASRQKVGDGHGARLRGQQGGVARLEPEGHDLAGGQGLGGGTGGFNDVVVHARDGPDPFDLQVIAQGGKALDFRDGHVVGMDPGTVAQHGVLGNVIALYAGAGLRCQDLDGTGPGGAQFQALHEQVIALAAGLVGQRGTDVGGAAGGPGLFRPGVPDDAGVIAGGPAVVGAPTGGCILEGGATGAVGAGKVRRARAYAVFHGALATPVVVHVPGAEVAAQVEGRAVDHLAQDDVPVGHAAPVAEGDAAAHVLSRCHVVDDGVFPVGGLAHRAAFRQGQRGIGKPDLAGASLDLVDQRIGEAVVAGAYVLDGLSAEGAGADGGQFQGVVDLLLDGVVGNVGPKHDRLVGHPEIAGIDGKAGVLVGRGVLQAGVDAADADLYALAGGQTVGRAGGHAGAPVGDDGGGVARVRPQVQHALVHVEGATGQQARCAAAYPGAAAALAGLERTGRAVCRVGGIGGRAPVVQAYGLRVAADIEVDGDGLAGVERFDALLAVAAGIACQQAHQHAVIETVPAPGATGFLKRVGLGITGIGPVDHHVVEGRGADGQRAGQGRWHHGRGVLFARLQGRGRHGGAIGHGAEDGGPEVGGLGTRAGKVVQHAGQGLVVGRDAGAVGTAFHGLRPFGHGGAIGLFRQGQGDARVFRAARIGNGHPVGDFVVGAHAAVAGAAVQAGAVAAVPARGAIGFDGVGHGGQGGVGGRAPQGQCRHDRSRQRLPAGQRACAGDAARMRGFHR